MTYKNHHAMELCQQIMQFLSLKAFQKKLNKYAMKHFVRGCCKILHCFNEVDVASQIKGH